MEKSIWRRTTQAAAVVDMIITSIYLVILTIFSILFQIAHTVVEMFAKLEAEMSLRRPFLTREPVPAPRPIPDEFTAAKTLGWLVLLFSWILAICKLWTATKLFISTRQSDTGLCDAVRSAHAWGIALATQFISSFIAFVLVLCWISGLGSFTLLLLCGLQLVCGFVLTKFVIEIKAADTTNTTQMSENAEQKI